MSNVTPMKLGFPTKALAGTQTTQNIALGTTNALYVIIHNAGTNPIFVNSGDSSITVTFPTGTAQSGAIIGAGVTATYMKNNAKDTHIAYICGTSLTTTAYVQAGEGV